MVVSMNFSPNEMMVEARGGSECGQWRPPDCVCVLASQVTCVCGWEATSLSQGCLWERAEYVPGKALIGAGCSGHRRSVNKETGSEETRIKLKNSVTLPRAHHPDSRILQAGLGGVRLEAQCSGD